MCRLMYTLVWGDVQPMVWLDDNGTAAALVVALRFNGERIAVSRCLSPFTRHVSGHSRQEVPRFFPLARLLPRHGTPVGKGEPLVLSINGIIHTSGKGLTVYFPQIFTVCEGSTALVIYC